MYTCPNGHKHDRRDAAQAPDGRWLPACPVCGATYEDPPPATPPQQDPAVAPPMVPATVTQRTAQEPGAVQSPHLLRPYTTTEPGVPPAPASPTAPVPANLEALRRRVRELEEEQALQARIRELEGMQQQTSAPASPQEPGPIDQDVQAPASPSAPMTGETGDWQA